MLLRNTLAGTLTSLWYVMQCDKYPTRYARSMQPKRLVNILRFSQHVFSLICRLQDEIPDSLVREGDGPDGNYPMRSKFEKMCREAQIAITKAIEDIDGAGSFQEDCWTRANGGGGMSRVLSNGKVFEKAGVNLSVVYGSMPQEALQAATERGVDRSKGMAPGERVPFFACGLSSVMHPKNPKCPTMHFNYRYFETDGGVWWFGGGTDISK